MDDKLISNLNIIQDQQEEYELWACLKDRDKRNNNGTGYFIQCLDEPTCAINPGLGWKQK